MTTKRPLTKAKGFNYRQTMQVIRPGLVAELEGPPVRGGFSFRSGADLSRCPPSVYFHPPTQESQMFIRWRHQKISGFGGNWQAEQGRDGMESHLASLLRSDREGSRVRQSVIANCGHFVTRDGKVSERDAGVFWRKAMAALDRLELSDGDRRKAEDQLSTVVEKYVTDL